MYACMASVRMGDLCSDTRDLCNKVNFEDACFCYSTDFFGKYIHIFLRIFLNHLILV